MGAALWLWLSRGQALAIWVQALGGLLIGTLVYGLVSWRLRVPELAEMGVALRRRLTRAESEEVS